MKLITAQTARDVNNSRVTEPFIKPKFLRFPTTKEVETAFLEISDQYDMPMPLVDRFFPESNTLATSIEMFLTRVAPDQEIRMTFPHLLDTEVRTFETNSSVDIARASWSPIEFEWGKAWGAKQMLEMGRLDTQIAQSQFNGEVGDALIRMKKGNANRKDWMCWNVLRNGKIIIDRATPDNPDKLVYNIDYGVTDHVMDLPIKWDDKDGSGKSLVDPVESLLAYNRAQKFTGRRIVELVVNSNFVEYLTDNTFIRTSIDWDRGATTFEATAAPRSLYRERALGVFTRLTGITVTTEDSTFVDPATSQVSYYFPDGEALILIGSSGPLGTFENTAHLMSADAQGNVSIGTGEYVRVQNNMNAVKPNFGVFGGFNGLPRLDGYDPLDFGLHKFKWMKFARNSVQNPALPVRVDYTKLPIV